jgi:hypothetical protein
MGKKNKNKNVITLDDDINDNDNNDNNDDNDWNLNTNKKKINLFSILEDEDRNEKKDVNNNVKKDVNNNEKKDINNNEKKLDVEIKRDKKEIFELAYAYDSAGCVDEAIRYYKIADELGSFYASGNLAILLDENDKPGAEEYYVKSIKNGNIGSLFDYAGYLVDKVNDVKKGHEYFCLYLSLKNADSYEKKLWKKIVQKKNL